MALIPQTFPAPQETAVASYNYTDIAEGTGMIIFYGYLHTETATQAYAISDAALYSNDIWTSGVTTDTTYTKILDLDFDLSAFNLPKRIKGTARFNVCAGAGSEATSGTQADMYIHARLRKWDGSTETEIADDRSEAKVLGNIDGVGYIDYWMFNFEVDIATLAHFKKGDQLRVTIELWGKRTGANNPTCILLHDPKNRLTSTASVTLTSRVPKGNNGNSAGYDPVSSILEMHIPFVLDL